MDQKKIVANRLSNSMIDLMNKVHVEHQIPKSCQIELGLILFWQRYGWIPEDSLRYELLHLKMFDGKHKPVEHKTDVIQ